MVTVIAIGKVEDGKVVITAAALPRQADPLPVKPTPDGREMYLRCLESEGCPAEWADNFDSKGIYHE